MQVCSFNSFNIYRDDSHTVLAGSIYFVPGSCCTVLERFERHFVRRGRGLGLPRQHSPRRRDAGLFLKMSPVALANSARG